MVDVAYEVTKRIKGRDYRYRVEGYRNSALAEAFTLLADRTFGNMTLHGPLGTREEEVRRVWAWLQTFHGALLRRRAFRWSFTAIEGSKAMARLGRALLEHDATVMLTAYLGRLRDAGLANVDDPYRLAEGIMRISVVFVHFSANNEQNPERLDLRLSGAFPVIERAIFGSPDERHPGFDLLIA